MWGRRKPVVKYVERVVTRPVDTTENAALKDRTEDFLKRAEDEYARLYKEFHENMDNAEKGTFDNRYDRASMSGKMMVISDAMSIIKGTDSVVEGYRLDKMAANRINETFPITSILASTHPIYVR